MDRQVFVYKGQEYSLPSEYTPEQAKAKILAHLEETEQPKDKTSFAEDAKLGLAGVGTTFNNAAYLARHTLQRPFVSQEENDKLFEELNKKNEGLQKWANPTHREQGVGGALVSGVVGLPGMLLAPAAGLGTAKDFIDRGESLGRAGLAGMVDSGMNVLGTLIPAGRGLGLLKGASLGAGVNVAQGAAADAIIQQIAEKEATREAYNPFDPNRRASEAVLGAGFGAVFQGKRPPVKTKEGELPKVADILDAEKQKMSAQRIPEQLELPLENTPQQIAEMRARQTAQPDLFAPRNEPFAERLPESLPQEARLPKEQAELPFNTSPEEIAFRQADKSPQMDMFAEDFRRQTENDPYGVQQQLDAERQQSLIDPMRQEEAARPFVDERLDAAEAEFQNQKRMEMEQAFKQREQQVADEQHQRSIEDVQDQLSSVEEQLRKQAYQPPTQESLRAERGRPIKGPRSQRGSLDLEAFDNAIKRVGTIFSSVKPKGGNTSGRPGALQPRGEIPEVVGTTTHPVNSAQLGVKQELANKLKLMRQNFPEYSRITTPEEAKLVYAQKPVKDIPHNIVRNKLYSGAEGLLRQYPDNPFLNLLRTTLQEGRNNAEVFSKKYVTGPEGYVTVYRKLTKDEWVRVSEVLQGLSERRITPTKELLDKLGLNENQQNLIFTHQKAFDALFDVASNVNQKLGFPAFDKLEGYSPATFPGGYKAIVSEKRVSKKTGEPIAPRTISVINADTRGEFKIAKKHYEDKGYTVGELERKGLPTNARQPSGMFNGFNDIVNLLAENNPEFAKMKEIADDHTKGKIKQLYSFNVHELKKSGVEGSAGDKPWLSAEQNAKDHLEAIINHLEEGAKFYNYQEPLGNISKILSDPEVKLRNTKKYMEEHARHITGQNLNPIGAATNWVVDGTAALFGKSFKVPNKWANELGNLSALHMMGLYNPAFLGMQLTQFITGGLPEAMKIRAATGLHPAEIAKSFNLGAAWNTALSAEKNLGVSMGEAVPTHIREAASWAREHGMFDFSELELAHTALKNEKLVKAQNVAALPMSFGERATRPGVFMAFVDIFHKFGLQGEEGLKVAQNATDFSMGNYHPDERPHIYQEFGVLGQGMGKLTTFKHNQITQWLTRGKDAINGRSITPLAAMAALSLSLSGVTGLPGYQELDWLVQKLSGGNRIRDLVMPSGDMPSPVLDGPASYYTGFDFQSRLGMNRILPDSVGAALNPQLANIGGMLGAVASYAKNRDEMSFNEMVKALTPQGMKGFTEDVEDNYPLDKEGKRIFSTPRTETEQDVRKWTGIRPLKETVERADTWAWKKRELDTQKELKNALARQKAAASLGDWESYRKWGQQAVALGADPNTVFSAQGINKSLVDKNLSEQERFLNVLSPAKKDLSKLKELARRRQEKEEAGYGR